MDRRNTLDQPGLFAAPAPPPSAPPVGSRDDDDAPPPPPVPPVSALDVAGREHNPFFDGDTFVAELDGPRLANQVLAVEHAMADGNWHTLGALAGAVRAPQPSVSARLRDLRKPRFGGRVIERRRHALGGGLFEYRMDPDARTEPPKPDPTLRHAVLVRAVNDADGAPAPLSLACQHCDWRYRMPSGQSIEQLSDALARHP